MIEISTVPDCFDSHPECPACEGTGYEGADMDRKVECPDCRGDGYVNCDACHAHNAVYTELLRVQSPAERRRHLWRQILGMDGEE